MIIDGKQLANDIKLGIKSKIVTFVRAPHLVIVLVGDNPMSVKYTSIKKQLGEELGVKVTIQTLAGDSTTYAVEAVIKKAATDESVDGIIVQLPLPDQVDRDSIIAAIPAEKDVDALTQKPIVLSPVVMAIKTILEKSNQLALVEKKAVVIGRGRLVGEPVAVWLKTLGADVTVLDTETPPNEFATVLAEADLVVTGAGVPGLVKPEMVKDGVVLIDASTSDVNGKTVGDIDPRCADKALLYTPVPGGVGPLTVVMLFANLISLMKK